MFPKSPYKIESKIYGSKAVMAKLVALACVMTSTTFCSGTLFDLHVINQPEVDFDNQINACQALGYDGLAVLSTPETYAYAMKITETFRANEDATYFIGLRRDLKGEIMWDDGTPVALDVPWDIPPDNIAGRVKKNGLFAMGDGTNPHRAICGKHNKFAPSVGFGTINNGQKPTGVVSTLSLTIELSYLRCSLQCGRDAFCRAATFDQDLNTCSTYVNGSYSGLVAHPSSTTFVRNGFL